MKAIKTISSLLVLLIILPSCGSDLENHTPVESNFPLKQVQIFPMEEVQKIAASNSWIVIYTPDKITAVDTEAQELLWSPSFNVFTDFDSEFQISNDTLIAASTDQIILVDKSGSKRTLNLDPKGGSITRLVAIYPNYLYVIRVHNVWTLEAYDISQNALLWTTRVGRGGCDVFYVPSENIAYVTTRDNSIRAFDNATGKVVWEQDRSSLHSAFEGGVLYTVEHTSDTNKFQFSAFDVESQQELWKKDITPITHVYKLTIIDKFLIASERGGLIALNKSSGDEVWQTDTGEPFYTRPVEFDDVIYAKGPSFTVYAISPSDGDVIGFVQLESENPIFAQPKYEVLTGVYRLKDGIAVNTRNAVVIYKAK